MKTRWFRVLMALMIVVSFGILFVASGDNKAQELSDGDVPILQQPRPIGDFGRADRIGGQTFAVVVEGDFAYIGAGLKLSVVDVTTPGNATVISRTAALPNVILDVDFDDGYVYVAAGRAGLRVIDVSEPSAPVEVGMLATSGSSRGVYIEGFHAYVADAWAGLQVIDISNPTGPVLVGTSETLEQDFDVFVQDNFAYVAAGEDGLRIVDVSRPDTPVEVGVFDSPSDVNGVYVDNGFAYLAAGGGGLRVIDVTAPGAPVEVGAFEPQYARQVFVDNDLAYVVTERNGLFVLDVLDPTAPVLVINFDVVGSANSVFVHNDHIYVADGVGGLFITRVARQRQPQPVAPTSPLFLPLRTNALSTMR